jgi:ribonuclease P protein component
MKVNDNKRRASVLKPLRDFKKFFQIARKGHGKNFILYHWSSSELLKGEVEFACVASRKSVSKRAIRRNKAKRRIKAAVYDFFSQNNVNRNMKIFIAAKNTAVSVAWEELLLELHKAMARILKGNEN